MNIDQNKLFSYDTFNSYCAKRQKTAFFRHEFYKNCPKSQFHENADGTLS